MKIDVLFMFIVNYNTFFAVIINKCNNIINTLTVIEIECLFLYQKYD